jgi:cytochrome c-type biogenesis protein CcmE
MDTTWKVGPIFYEKIMKKRNVQLLLGGFFVTLGIIYLIYIAIPGSTVYYLTVEEFLEQQEALADEGVRIAGTVADGSIQRHNPSSEITFAIRGISEEMLLPVHYKGTIPDIFRDGASVVLEGKYDHENKFFHAVTLMTSCPSKYESKLKEP